MRICNICNIEKPLDGFFKASKYTDGYERRCKDCKTVVNRASYMRNRDEVKWRSIKRKYKLTQDQFHELAIDGCQVCGSQDQLCVDHDHSCCDTAITCGNCVRGVLCKRCNIAEGLFKNDPKNLKKLIKYMTKHGIL